MIRFPYTRLLALLTFILMVVSFVSCNKDDNDKPNDGKATLYSFGPTGAKVGDTLRFIGANLDQVSSVKFTGVNALVDKANFKSQSSDLITLLVPATTEKGKLVLKLSNGDSIVTKTALNIGVKTTVTSITTQARPGTNVTIKGDYLNWIDRVTFNKNKLVKSFVSQSQTQLVVKIPDDAETGTLVLHYSGTDSADLETKDTLHVTLPVTTSFNPNPAKHGTNVTINGTDLDLVKKVYFNGVTNAVTTFVSQSATQLVVAVPGTTTKGKVKLEAASGVQTTSSTDLDIAMPTITSMTPNPVDPSGNLTITGTNLDLVSSIAFTGVATAVSTFVSQSSTQLVVQVPAATLKGKITLNIKNSTLSVQSANVLDITGSTVDPYVVYDNALNTNWQQWGGWGTSTQEMANTEHAASVSNAIKVTYSDAYGGFQLHPANTFAFPGAYTKLKISIYGGTNATGTSTVAIYMKDATDPTDAQKKKLTLVPGTFTTFEIPLSDFSNNPAKINEFVIQNYGTANITIYIDDIIFL